MYSVFLKLLEERGCTVADVSRATGIRESTMSNWKRRDGKISADAIAKIAAFFDVPTDVFFGKEAESGARYYLDDETAEIAQQIFEDKDLRALFDATRGVKPQDLKMVTEMLKRFKETNNE